MNLDGPQIKSRAVIGMLGKSPVTMIETSGGLHLIVMAKSGTIKTLGAGPHRAVAMFTAEKREPDIVWNEELTKSEDYLEKNCPTCRQVDHPDTCICQYRWLEDAKR